MQLRLFVHVVQSLLPALGIAVELALASTLVAAVVGLGLAVISQGKSRLGRRLVKAYVEFLRNTPLIVQMFFVFFGLPFLGIQVSPFEAAFLSLALQHTAFFAEIYRAGFENVSLKSRDAAKAIGLSGYDTLRLIVIPQAVIRMLPAIGNEIVQIVKDTSIASTIAVAELTLRARDLTEQTSATYIVFAALACYYLILNGVISLGLRFAEKTFAYAE